MQALNLTQILSNFTFVSKYRLKNTLRGKLSGPSWSGFASSPLFSVIMCMELARPFDPFLVAVVEVISPLAPFVSLKKTSFVRKSQKFKAAKS
jgi:hypothetical protein